MKERRFHFFLLRSGALGDVITVRAAIGMLRTLFPDCSLVLAAPGERGQLFARFRVVDRVFDLDRAEATWLYSRGEMPPPPRLSEAVQGCSVAFVYAKDEEGLIQARLSDLGMGEIIITPPHPPEGEEIPIHSYLIEPIIRWAQSHHGELPSEPQKALQKGSFPLSFFRVEEETLSNYLATHRLSKGFYVVIHPGSGSPKKNWPLDRFIAIGKRLSRIQTVVILEGEADRDLGKRMKEAIPESILLISPPLEELAMLFAGAELYLGNDSGVSHLASAVWPTPRRVILFGPTSPGSWGMPGATILHAEGGNLANLSVETVEQAIFS